MNLKPFTDHIAGVAREHGYVMGLGAALDILRAHGVDVRHPARKAIYAALMAPVPDEVKSTSPRTTLEG